jgi:hypothetical protein
MMRQSANFMSAKLLQTRTLLHPTELFLSVREYCPLISGVPYALDALQAHAQAIVPTAAIVYTATKRSL